MNKKEIRNIIYNDLKNGFSFQDIFNRISGQSKNDYEKTKLAEIFSFTPTPDKIVTYKYLNNVFFYLLVLNFALKIFLFFYVLPILLKVDSTLFIIFFWILIAFYFWMIWVVFKIKLEAYKQVGYLLILNFLSIQNIMNPESDLYMIALFSSFLNLLLIILSFYLGYKLKTKYSVSNVEYTNEEGKIDLRKDFLFYE